MVLIGLLSELIFKKKRGNSNTFVKTENVIKIFSWKYAKEEIAGRLKPTNAFNLDRVE